MDANPGSIAKLKKEGGKFEALLISYKPTVDGWIAGCRPIIGLDGCHLKGKYGGCCLSMVGLDGDNGIVPLGIYLCRSEDTKNWTNFLREMSPYIGSHQERLIVMSDRQKGLDHAVSEIFPEAGKR